MLQSKQHCILAAALALCTSGGVLHAGSAPVKSSEVVAISVKADKTATDGTQTIHVTLTISPSFHILANPVGDEILVDSQTTIRVRAGGKPLAAKITYPQGNLVKNEAAGLRFRIYEGKVTSKVTVVRTKRASGPLEILVAVQASDSVRNLRPSRLTATVP